MSTVTGKELAELIDVARSTLSEATKKGYKCAGLPVSEWARRSESGRVQGYDVPGQLLDGDEGDSGDAAAAASTSSPPAGGVAASSRQQQAYARRREPSEELRAIRERRRQERREREQERRKQERERRAREREEWRARQREREERRARRRKERLWPPPGEKREVDGTMLCTREDGTRYEMTPGYMDQLEEEEGAGELEPTDTGDRELLPDYDAGTADDTNEAEGPNPPENGPDSPNSPGSVPKSRALVPVEDDSSGEEDPPASSWGEWAGAVGLLGAMGWLYWEAGKAEAQLANQRRKQNARRSSGAPPRA